MNTPFAPTQPLDLTQSAAGEEDPGAVLDLPAVSGGAVKPSRGAREACAAQPPISPGDEAPAGTPGTGEDVCPDCGGSGKRAGRDCTTCQGTGRVTVGIGGA